MPSATAPCGRCALKRSDRLPDHAELAQALGFTEQVCADVTGAPVTVTACCARAGMADPGFARFASDLTSYLHTFGHRDARRAERAHVARLLTVPLDEVRVRLRLLDLADEGQTHAIQELGDRPVAVTTRAGPSPTPWPGRCDGSAPSWTPPPAPSCQCWSRTAARGSTNLGGPAGRRPHRPAGRPGPSRGDRPPRWLGGALAPAPGDRPSRRPGCGLPAVLEDLEEQRLAAEAVRDLLDLSISSHPLDPQLLDQDRFSDEFTPPEPAPPLAGTLARLAGGTRRRRRIRQSLTAQIPWWPTSSWAGPAPTGRPVSRRPAVP